jgi:hypothetical protein
MIVVEEIHTPRQVHTQLDKLLSRREIALGGATIAHLQTPTHLGKPVTLVLAEINRWAFDFIAAMYREGIRIRYALSQDAFAFMLKGKDGPLLHKMNKEDYILERYVCYSLLDVSKYQFVFD